MQKRLTLKTVNRAIQKKYPLIYIYKGERVFIVWSDDIEMQLKLSALFQISIEVYALNQQSVSKWVEDVEWVLRDNNRHYGEKEPII
jgi:hypothetical protein